MGASLAIALRGKVRRLYGLDASPANLLTAKHHFDGTSSDPTSVRDSDVIILAIPIRAILKVLTTLATNAKPGALVLDLGSAKVQIVAAMNALPDHLLAVAGHPMCGKESSGPGGADANMYKKARFVLCRTERTTDEALAFVQRLVTLIGARPIVMDAAEHDHAVALISHLPYLVSSALVGTVQADAGEAGDHPAWDLAASGFRDTSRLAGSDITMMTDTLAVNRETVLAALDLFQTEITELREQLAAGDDAGLRARLEQIRHNRNVWYKAFTERA